MTYKYMDQIGIPKKISYYILTSGTATKLSKPNASSTSSQSAVTAPKEENNQNIANNILSSSCSSLSKEDEKTDMDVSPINLEDSEEVSRSREIIEALKAKIREYEKYVKNKPRCLICLEDYVNKNPVVSISLWERRKCVHNVPQSHLQLTFEGFICRALQ